MGKIFLFWKEGWDFLISVKLHSLETLHTTLYFGHGTVCGLTCRKP